MNSGHHDGPHDGLGTLVLFRGRGFRGRGFTLVEMLVAMVLSAVLMSALMSVASAAAGDRQRLRERVAGQEPAWVEPLARQFEADLLMGVGVSEVVYTNAGGGGPPVPTIYLITHRGVGDGPKGTGPVVVSYQLIQAGEQRVLTRRQVPMTRPEGGTRRGREDGLVEVLAVGVDAVGFGAATLSYEARAVDSATERLRTESAFTLLVDNRPVPFHRLPAQVPWSVTVQDTEGPSRRPNNTASSASFGRTLLTQ